MEKIKKSKMKANALQLKKSMVVLSSMVEKNIKNQYRRSVLGIVWTVLNPLLNMIVMAFVFSSIFGRADIEMDYPVYVLSGTIVFTLMRVSTSESLTCMVDNYDLLTKTRVPYAVFPVSHTFSSTVNFGFSLIALIIVLFMAIVAMANGTSMDAMIAQASEFSKVNYAEGEQLIPVKDENGDWCFTTDREFKIMQLTDVHIGGGSFSTKNDAWAMNAVAAMISAEKPENAAAISSS